MGEFAACSARKTSSPYGHPESLCGFAAPAWDEKLHELLRPFERLRRIVILERSEGPHICKPRFLSKGGFSASLEDDDTAMVLQMTPQERST